MLLPGLLYVVVGGFPGWLFLLYFCYLALYDLHDFGFWTSWNVSIDLQYIMFYVNNLMYR